MAATFAPPDINASIDRLTLGIDSPRGAQASMISVLSCFDAETAGVIPCTPTCGCFEVEASGLGMLGWCAASETE